VQALTGVFVVVYDGQHALKFALGRATGVVGPGINFKWPIIQRFRVVDTKDTTIDLAACVKGRPASPKCRRVM
jgi:regulator of protease activity HflC (stomatin/prohibitin superfamily)